MKIESSFDRIDLISFAFGFGLGILIGYLIL